MLVYSGRSLGPIGQGGGPSFHYLAMWARPVDRAAGRCAVSRLLKTVVVAVLLAGILAASAGCGGAGGDVTGTWRDRSSGDVYDFRADGTLTISISGLGSIPATYVTDGGTLTLDIEGFSEESVASYGVQGDIMTISPEGEDPITLERE